MEQPSLLGNLLQPQRIQVLHVKMINMKRDTPRTLKNPVSDYMRLLLTSDHSSSRREGEGEEGNNYGSGGNR